MVLAAAPLTSQRMRLTALISRSRMKGPGTPFPLESIYRDAKIGEIYEGANEIQNWVIARQIFGREITG